ncbi:hypothetical protein [Paenibacillus chitinolyticus]|uniref:hypothetical protein n=1 Tax=Paenibacillus chitinolyticus TaxID=79263 RepID=UPI00366EA52D
MNNGTTCTSNDVKQNDAKTTNGTLNNETSNNETSNNENTTLTAGIARSDTALSMSRLYSGGHTGS